MRAAWKKLRYRFEYVGLLLAAKIVPLFPRATIVVLAKICGAIASRIDTRGRSIALANLDCAFPGKYSISEKSRIIRESYQHFAQTMLDLMWSPRLTPENFLRYIEFEGFPEVDPNKSGIVVCYHYSNFEWLSLGSGFRGRPSTIIAQEFKNPLLDPIFRRWREQSGHVFSARTGGVLRLFKTLRRGGNIAMLVDLTVFPGPRRSRFDVLECTPVLLPLTPGSSNAREPLLFPLIASRCREDGIVWFFIRQLILVPTPARAKLRRRAGIPLSRSCARSPGHGCGCTNTGVIARRILIGPTPSIPGTPESSKD
jgi:Lauroyl/myristoyl acyltransferase